MPSVEVQKSPMAGPSEGTPTNAYALLEQAGTFKSVIINRRPLMSHDVSIKIMYCGICHTDIHIARNEWGTAHYPVIPGHEITGVIDGVGAEVTKFKLNDKCGVGFYVDTCGECRQCKEFKLEQHCEDGIVVAFNSEDKRNENGCMTCGGYSKSIVVNEKYVFLWPQALPMDSGAPLLCAGITVYSPLKRFIKKQSSDGSPFRVAIIGIGGLGHIAIKIAKALGANVTAIGRESESKRKFALELKADQYVALERLSNQSAGSVDPFDLIIDTISVDHKLDNLLALLKLNGVLVPVGLPGEPMSFNARYVVSNRRSIVGSVVGSLDETQEMLNLCADHNILCMVETIKMDYVDKAYERAVNGDVNFRFVIDITNSSWD